MSTLPTHLIVKEAESERKLAVGKRMPNDGGVAISKEIEVEAKGLEPMTAWLQTRCSTN